MQLFLDMWLGYFTLVFLVADVDSVASCVVGAGVCWLMLGGGALVAGGGVGWLVLAGGLCGGAVGSAGGGERD